MTKIQPKSERLLKPGWYPAEIGEVEERETKFGTKLLVPFEVTDNEGTVGIDAWLSISDHPKSNLVKWAKQLFGDREFDTDELTDIECEASVVEGEDSEGNPKNKISKLRPLKKGKAGGKANGKGEKEEVTISEEDFNDLPL